MVSGIFTGAGTGAVVSIIIKATDNYSKEFKKLDKSVSKQQTGFKKLKTTLSGVGLGYAALAGAVIGFATDSVKSFLEAEKATQAFNAVLGETANLMLRDLREASKGLASDFELMNSANKAMALGIDQNQLPELLKVAAARGKVTGRTVSEAFQDITIGIGRQSPLILDNLGIIIDLNDAYIDFAESIGKTKDELTEFEKKQAVTNRVLEESQGIMRLMELQQETNAEKIERLSAGWDNFKVAVGSTLIDLVDTAKELGNIVIAYDLWSDDITSPEVQRAAKEQLETWEDLTEEVKEATQRVEDYRRELQNLTQGPFIDELEIRKKLAEVELDLAKERDWMGDMDKHTREIFGESTQRNIDNLEEEREKLQNELDVIMGRRDVISATVDLYTALEDEQKKTTYTALTDIPKIIEKIDLEKIALAEAREGADNFTNSLNDGIESNITNMERLESYTKRIFRILSGGLTGTISSLVGGLGFKSVGDAIIKPNGEIITTHPDDYIIATKNPGSMGGGGVTLIVEGDLIGLDATDISRRLSDELNTKVSL